MTRSGSHKSGRHGASGTKSVPSKKLMLELGDESKTSNIAWSVMRKGYVRELQLRHLERAFEDHRIQADPDFLKSLATKTVPGK